MRFASRILPAWSRKSPRVAEVLPLLYLHGLSSNDFGPALEQFLGSGAGLSASTITRLTEQWQGELSTKFGIDAELVLASTVRRLERDLPRRLLRREPGLVERRDHCPLVLIARVVRNAVPGHHGQLTVHEVAATWGK